LRERIGVGAVPLNLCKKGGRVGQEGCGNLREEENAGGRKESEKGILGTATRRKPASREAPG